MCNQDDLMIARYHDTCVTVDRPAACLTYFKEMLSLLARLLHCAMCTAMNVGARSVLVFVVHTNSIQYWSRLFEHA